MKNTKKLKYRLNSSVIIIGAIIAAILINSILVTFDDKMSLEIDLTQNEIYKLSDASIDVAKGVLNDTKIGILYDGREVTENDQFLALMTAIIDEYTQINPKITHRLIDYYNDPSPLLKEFPQTAIQELYGKQMTPMYAMIFVSGDRYEVADANSYVEQAYDKSRGEIVNKSNIEEVVTNKLARFSNEVRGFTSILYTTGHGEKINSTVGNLLNKYDLVPRKIEFSSYEKAENENPLIIIDSPTADFTTEEIEKMDNFLRFGGNVQVYFNPLLSNDELPRLESYLADEWGIVRNHGVIYDNQKALKIDENMKSVYGVIAVAEFAENEIVEDIAASGMRLMYSSANALEIKADKEAKIKTESVIKTSKDALLKSVETATSPETSDGVKGEYNVILTSQKEELLETGERYVGKVLVCGSSYTMDTLPLQSDCANEELLINSFDWMSGENTRIDIDLKDFPEGGLVIENAPKWVWFATLVVIIPLAVLSIGIFVFVKRRYK